MTTLNTNTSYFEPAVIVGHVAGVQNSIRVPYKMLTWLKKSTATKKEKYFSTRKTFSVWIFLIKYSD